MKDKKKGIISVAVLLILTLLIPIPNKLKDGKGTKFKAVLYQVTKYNKLNVKHGYDIDWEIKILGRKVYQKRTSKYIKLEKTVDRQREELFFSDSINNIVKFLI